MTNADTQGGSRNFFSDRTKLCKVAVLAVFAYLCFVNLDWAPFWDDEAIAPSIARNLLASGSPLADDGRNVMSYYSGADIAPDLTYRYPRLGIYLQAGMFSLFGEGEIQARLLSALLSLAAMVLFTGVLRREFPNRPGFVTLALAFACLMPITLSYARSATYNSAVLFFNILLFWSYLRFCERPRAGYAIVITLAALAAFHCHYLSGAVFAVSLSVFHLLFRRSGFSRRAWLLAGAAALPYLANVAWYAFFEYSGGGYASRGEPFSAEVGARMLSLYFLGLNHAGILPWTVAALFACHRVYLLLVPGGKADADNASAEPRRRGKKPRRRKESARPPRGTGRWQKLCEDRVFQFLAFVAIFTFILALVAPHSSRNDWADTRYFSTVAPFAAPVSAAVALWAWRSLRLAGILVCVALLLSNVAGWPFLKHIVRADSPQWTLPKLAAEYHREYPMSMRPMLSYLREHAGQDDVVFSPAMRSSRLIYYLSDRILVCCDLRSAASLPENLRTEGREHLFRENVLSGAVKPDWIVYFGMTPEADSLKIYDGGPKYRLVKRIPAAVTSYAELHRPEPFWHESFPQENPPPVNSIGIYRVGGR